MSVTKVASPFDPDNEDLYRFWRDRKLKNYPTRLEDLLVDVKDPRCLSSAEYKALLQICRKTNMALYRGKTESAPEKKIILSVAGRFGLHQLNNNWLADEEGVTALTIAEEGTRQEYIPYTNRPLNWHTDGYYNSRDKQIRTMLLHCVQEAESGGENMLLDHEIVYILLREQDPNYIRALLHDDVMSIPPRMAGKEVVRSAESGPVFSIDASSGNLHMRYTARTRSIEWKEDFFTREALAYLKEILNSDSPYIFRGLLQSGMGLVSNNVLHGRSGFNDNEGHPRFLFRARYFDRIAGCDISKQQF
ncbi:MAG: TauD/TfdA family dioxygenase [SAR324 cluster bacterium]|nr:TauD/TfdA family dioxygenase [SAR324 cluster bacterium]